jgi:hypothetical protein
MNCSTIGIRSRTELMFQVASRFAMFDPAQKSETEVT